MDPIIIGGILWLLLGKSKGGGIASVRSSDPATDGAVLEARANQPTARKWAPIFISQDVPPLLADALARWAGIESSGSALATSELGERGLLQCMASTALQAHGPYTHEEWARLADVRTTSEQHAALAYKLANWLWLRAKRFVANPPSGFIDGAWYAKLYHQYPKDLKTGGMHGPALMMARALKGTWRNDDKKMHRLRAANVVAFGVSDP